MKRSLSLQTRQRDIPDVQPGVVEILRLWTTAVNFAYSIKGGGASVGMWMEALALVACGIADDIAAHTAINQAAIINIYEANLLKWGSK